MIDIVITYVYERDKKWQQDFKYWKDKELLNKTQNKANRQAFGIERTREWDILKYWFRSIENTCKWVNKIFFVVQNKNHIPKWLNTDKVRVVYHDEFIPKELLPTFNAMTIGMYISNIKDLSEHYIMFDDDMYFLNEITEDRFFKDNKPVQLDNKIPFEYYNTNGDAEIWWKILNNNLDFEKKYMKNLVKYGIYHLPEARSKSFEQKIIQENKQEILDNLKISKFRHPSNLCPCMFCDLLKICNKAYLDNPYKNSYYCTLKSSVNFKDYDNADMVCFNDTELLDDYELTKKNLIKFLDYKFLDKCSYEV